MIESGRRRITDRGTLARIARPWPFPRMCSGSQARTTLTLVPCSRWEPPYPTGHNCPARRPRRKAGHPAAAIARLQDALRIDGHPGRGSAGLVLLARAAAAANRTDLFDETIGRCLRVLDTSATGQDALLSALTPARYACEGYLPPAV
jgi:hypothetical protein